MEADMEACQIWVGIITGSRPLYTAIRGTNEKEWCGCAGVGEGRTKPFFLWILLMSALPSSLVEPNPMCLIFFGRLRHSQMWSWQLGECCWIESQQGWVWVGEGWWWNLRYVQCVSLRRSLVNISSWSVNTHNGYGPCASNG